MSDAKPANDGPSAEVSSDSESAKTSESTNSPGPADREPIKRPGWFTGLRLWPAVVIVALGTAGVVQAQVRFPDEVTWREPFTFISLLATTFFLTLWWLFFSGVRWKTKLAVLTVPVSAGVLFLVHNRFDGYSGSVWPQWTPRYQWSIGSSFPWLSVNYVPSHAERLAEFAKSSGDATAKPTVDALVVDEDDWPGFRGALRDGIVRGDVSIHTNWNTTPPRELWRHPVGLGWSSFAVVDGLAFTQEQRDDREVVFCYDVDTGNELWRHADETRWAEPQGGDGPRATPTVYDGRVYTLGGTGILNCLDALTGKVVWARNGGDPATMVRGILTDAGSENIIWGMCGSPLVYDDLVVVNPGVNGEEGEYAVAAYHRLTGDVVWTAGKAEAAYSSPRLETIDGVRQVLIYDAAGLGGYDATSGEELWRYPWKTFSNVNVAQPIVRNERDVFIASGYSGSTKNGCTLLRVTRDGGKWDVAKVYEKPVQFKLKFNSGIYRDGAVYGLDDGMLACVDYAKGKRLWPKTRDAMFGFGQLIMVGDHLIVTHEKTGEIALVKASPERFEEVGRFRAFALGEGERPGIAWNHIAFWQGRLLVRNAREAICYDLRPATAVAER